MPDKAARPGGIDEPSAPGIVGLIERSVVLLLVLGLLIGVAAVLWPFATAILFGATLSIAGWPLRQALVSWGLGGALAAALLLMLSLLVVGLPVVIMAPILTEQLVLGTQAVQNYFAAAPEQPAWLAGGPPAGS